MIRNRNQKRGRNDYEDLGDDDDVEGQVMKEAKQEDGSDDEEVGGGWGDEDDDDFRTTAPRMGDDDDEEGLGRVGDDGEVKVRGGRITGVEGDDHDQPASEAKGLSDAGSRPGEEADNDGSYEARVAAMMEDNGGIPIVPFNLKQEMSEGKFTEDGMYIDNKFAETRDAWLEEVDSNDKKRKDKGEKIEDVKNVEIADFDKDDDELDILALKRDVLECLLPGESVSKALKRLRGSGKKPTDAGVGDFNKLMEAANNLLQAGEFGIYSESQLTIAESVEEAEKAEATGQWDLKWHPEGEVHGPFSTAQMVQWSNEGYFKQRPGLVRKRDPHRATETIMFKPSQSVNWEDEGSKADMLADLLDSDDGEGEEV